MTEIVKNNRKCICHYCRQEIKTKAKCRYNEQIYHLSCVHQWAIRKINEWRKVKNILAKHKNLMVIEKLK